MDLELSAVVFTTFFAVADREGRDSTGTRS
jgi:hypothetical protein